MGSFTYKLIKHVIEENLLPIDYPSNSLLTAEYFVNDLGDPAFDSSCLGNRKAFINDEIRKILSEEESKGLTYFHETRLFPTIAEEVLKELSLKKLIKRKDLYIEINNEELLLLKYGASIPLYTTQGKPLYFFTDLCYGFASRLTYDKKYSFIGEDQKKHCLNLIEVNKKLAINNRIFHLFSLVYRRKTKYSKRNGDSLDLQSFKKEKASYFLFFNNRNSKKVISDFPLEYDAWRKKNWKCFLNIKNINSISHQEKDSCTSFCHYNKLRDLVKKTILNLDLDVNTSPLVDILFYFFSKPSRICCNKTATYIKKLYKIVT